MLWPLFGFVECCLGTSIPKRHREETCLKEKSPVGAAGAASGWAASRKFHPILSRLGDSKRTFSQVKLQVALTHWHSPIPTGTSQLETKTEGLVLGCWNTGIGGMDARMSRGP